MVLRACTLVLAAGLALAGCAAVPMSQPMSSGRTVVGAPGNPNTDPRVAAQNFIAVVDAVEPVAEAECRARNPGANCDFRIVVDDRPGMPANAFQTRDAQGRPIIAFTIALITDVQNGDELAFVMAHEASHHILGHLDRQDQNAAIGAEVFGQLASITGTPSPDAIRAAQELGAAVGARSYSKDFELEADALGTVITADAGFDPLRGAEFFFRIPDPGNRFLGTHPPTAERVARVRQVAASLGYR